MAMPSSRPACLLDEPAAICPSTSRSREVSRSWPGNSLERTSPPPRCARRAQAFDLDVAWWGPRRKPSAPWPRKEGLLELAAWSDILLVACRANAENRGLISREVIEAVGADGMIVNVARGSVLDEDALIAALKAGRLGHAGLSAIVGGCRGDS